jgi:CheY-like chemotaxis protein
MSVFEALGPWLAPAREVETRSLPNGGGISFRSKVCSCSGETVKKKLRILGVDDEPVIGESITYVLEAPHRKIVVAKDGQEALALAAKEKFDVIITDHRMPRSGGLELVRKLRKRKYTGKIVVLSGHLSPENIGTYEELAVDEVVGKPLDSAELRELIAGLEDEV